MERMRFLRADISKVDSAKRFSKDLGVDVFQVMLFSKQEGIRLSGTSLRALLLER